MWQPRPTEENEILDPNDSNLKVGLSYKYTLKAPDEQAYLLRVVAEEDFNSAAGSLASVKHLALGSTERDGDYVSGSFTVRQEWAGAPIRIGFVNLGLTEGIGGNKAYTVTG